MIQTKNAAKVPDPILYRTKRDHINTPRFRHTNPSSKKMVLIQEKKRRAATIREESARLREVRVTQELITRQANTQKIQAQLEKRKRVMNASTNTAVKASMTQSPQQVVESIQEIVEVGSVEKIPDTLPEVPVIIQSTDLIQDCVPTDACIMEVVDLIQGTAMDKLIGIKTQTIAELAAMEIATVVVNTLTNFYPRSFEELEAMARQLVMWIDIIVSQCLTVEVVADLTVYEAEADRVIETITQLEADVPSEVSPTIIPTIRVTPRPMILILLTSTPQSDMRIYVPPPHFHWKHFQWCKRTRLKV